MSFAIPIPVVIESEQTSSARLSHASHLGGGEFVCVTDHVGNDLSETESHRLTDQGSDFMS
jgi:hypothetical protein